MSIIRQRFMAEKDSVIESSVGKAESWAKKVAAGQSGILLDDIPLVLGALGLKVVDRSKCCVDRAVFEAFKALATTAMNDPAKLVWEDDQQ